MDDPDRLQLSRRHFNAFAAFGLAAVAAPVAFPTRVEAADPNAPYTPTPGSVDAHVAAPEWFQDAKFGIYWHFGAFTTPEYGTEWYPRNMYLSGDVRRHHTQTYGDPDTVFGYEKFIDGGTDLAGRPVKFSPRLRSAGGQFDPDEWARIVKDSGARFAGPVAEHHDGFSMWDSRVNEWNSVAKGPQLDLLALFTTAVRAQGLKVVVAMHTAFNHNGFFQGVRPQSDPSLQKLYGQLPRATEDQLWLDKNKEVIDRARPDILWQDFKMDAIPEAKRDELSAYYYNAASAWGSDVVVTYKHDDPIRESGWVQDYERGGPADITTPFWLTDDTLSSSSWSYVQGLGYYSRKQMIHSLVDRVSKNGSLLLNISPTKEGVIPQPQVDLLAAIGAYLRRSGESIYSTRAWTVYGEGPNRAGGGSFTAPLSGGPTDVRYTRDKASRVLYATVLGWPGDNGTLTLTTLARGRVDLTTLTSVQLLGATAGTYTTLTTSQDSSGLRVQMPASAPVASDAYVVKLTFSGTIPAPSAGLLVQLYQDVAYAGASATLPVGRFTSGDLASRGLPVRETSSYRSADGLQLLGFTQEWFAGSPTILTGNDPDLRTRGLSDQLVSVVVRPDPARWFRVTSVVNGLALDGGGAAGASPSIKLWTPGSSTNLQFKLVETDSGYYRLVNRTNGQVADGLGSTVDGSVVGQRAWTGATSQQWLARGVGGEVLVFQNRATGRVLDSGGAVSSGAFAKQWTDNGSANFRWRLTAV